MPAPTYPKRLIEVDLPIKKISEHARREKSIGSAQISTMHTWWARKPHSSCRAVACAALWPDPADPHCPETFRIEAEGVMKQFWNPMGVIDRDFSNPIVLRQALLDFIAEYSKLDNSSDERFLSITRKLTQISHEALIGEIESKPLVVDPFAGGGSIPLEALRIGAEVYASDLNPVAVLLNKVILEYLPKYGKELVEGVRIYGQYVKEEAEKELVDYYPKSSDGSTTIAYLWARTIQCEGPGCGAEIPLISSLWLSKVKGKQYGIDFDIDKITKKISFKIIENPKLKDIKEGTVKRGATICPICGYTTPVASVRTQLKKRDAGVKDARLFCVVFTKKDEKGRFFRLPNKEDFDAITNVKRQMRKLESEWHGNLSLIPNESLPLMSGTFNAPIYGYDTWGKLFSCRQSITLLKFCEKIKEIEITNPDPTKKELITAISVCLALVLDRQAEHENSLCRWNASGPKLQGLFGRAAIPMHWSFAEANPFGDSVGDWGHSVENILNGLNNAIVPNNNANVNMESALKSSLPNDVADIYFTDPPYYNAVPYADLSDFFYVWLKRTVGSNFDILFKSELTPKDDEICEMEGWDSKRYPHKTGSWFERKMTEALEEGRRILKPSGLAIIIFAHKSTTGWEAMIEAIIKSGWIITASWPIDTEMATRLRGMNSSALASTIHLICRPRENPDGSLREDIADWRDILVELPIRIHEWMPRLSKEGVVGADAIFACLGPALEIYSRYSRVEKASGDPVPLREYLEHVWAAVSREALGTIFEGADATGFEEDARITAMWLWTLKTVESPALNGKNGNGIKEQPEESEEEEEEEAEGSGKKKVKGFSLEYDAARKIAQGLGAHLEEMHTLVEIKKGNARLLPVSERAAYLLKSEKEKPIRRQKKKERQSTLFPLELEGGETPEEDFGDVAEIGKTTLDRVHQSMLLFAAGQSDALKRFLVDEGIGKNAQFWTLAQALAALYPLGTEEKRWVEGVLARKKGLGL